jgi:hypothetical protein
MAHRHRLKGGLPRALGRHDGAQGRAYRRFYAALAQEFGPFASESFLALAAGRVARLWLELDAAALALAEARRARQTGKGRRPSETRVERLANRHRVADSAYAAALTELRELAALPEHMAERGRWLQERALARRATA